MGWKLWCCGAVVVGFVLNTLIEYGHFTITYNHLPGECKRFSMNGSEDMVLYPNNHVLISSGIFYHHTMMYNSEKPDGGIFLLDMNSASPEPVRLTLVGFPQPPHGEPVDIYPHGMSHWVDESGEMLLYFVNHRHTGDTVESFKYKPGERKLVHRRTFSDPLLRNLNDLVVVDVDRFYTTMDRYFANSVLRMLETYLSLGLGCVLFHDGERVMVASEGLKYPNGIAKSNNGRFVFVNELQKGHIVAYTPLQDNTLQRVQVFPVQKAMDNLIVDPVTGHIWAAVLVQALKVADHFKDHSVAVPSKCMHITVDQEAELPFSKSAVEEVFSSSGEDGVVGAVSVCMRVTGRLIVGSVCQDMMVCDMSYLRY